MKTFILFSLITSTLLVTGFAAAEEERSSAGFTQPAERPRVSHGPFRRQVIDSFYYGPHYSNYGHGYYPERAFWGYPYFPEPGRTTLWLAAGSHDYLGAGFQTSMMDPETGLTVSLLTSWESGETWWSGHDYETFRIAPTVAWSHRDTTFWLGFEHAENSLEGRQVIPRPRISLGGVLASGGAEPKHADSERKQAVSWDTDTLHAGLHHRVNDSAALSLSFSHSRSRD